MLWMVLLGGRSRSEEDVVGDPRIRNSSHSAATLLSRVLGAKWGTRATAGTVYPILGYGVPVTNACTTL